MASQSEVIRTYQSVYRLNYILYHSLVDSISVPHMDIVLAMLNKHANACLRPTTIVVIVKARAG